MKMFKKRSNTQVVFHPILLAVYPVLSLYVLNSDKLAFQTVLTPLVLSIAFGLLFWGIWLIILKDIKRSALISSVFMIFFISYRHFITGLKVIFYLLKIYAPTRFIIESQTGQIGLLVVFTLFWVLVIIKFRTNTGRVDMLTQVLNLVSVVLFISGTIGPLVSARISQKTIVVDWRIGDAIRKWDNQVNQADPLLAPSEGKRPDIYYIILDGFGRADVLQDLYDLDIRPFLRHLESEGFFVASDSRSNYDQTVLSLGSSLNFMYLDEIADQIDVDAPNVAPVYHIVVNHKINRIFHDMGYKIVSFQSGYDPTDMFPSDVKLGLTTNLNNFQNLIINNTPLSTFLIFQQYDFHRQRILYTLDHLSEVTKMEEPTFTFVHLFAPHPPFVLGANGESLYPSREYTISDGSDFMDVGTLEEYRRGYRYQALFITQKIQSVVDEILTRSPEPPIIILQGDHGPGSLLDHHSLVNTNIKERMSIFNAYYFPEGATRLLYPNITPVNTFRVVLNEFFGGKYPMLEDRSYYSPLDRPLKLTDVTDRLKSQ